MESAHVVLLFAEDPGAANFIAPLIPALRALGHRTEVVATGVATRVLKQRGVECDMLNSTEPDQAILDRLDPRTLVVGTASSPDTRGLTLIAAGRRAGIPTVGVVDAAMNSAIRFRGRGDNPLAYAPDWILVPDDVTRRSFLELGVGGKQVLALGHPHYDFVRDLAETWRHEPRARFRDRIFPAAAGRPIVVFVSEGSARAAPLSEEELAEYTLRGRSGSNGRTEIVLEELIDALANASPKPYLVLRVHPKDDAADFASYAPMIDKLSKDESALHVVYAADLVVGMTSMLLTEAELLGCAVLAIIPRQAEIEWLPLTRSGGLTAATTRTAIADRLRGLSPGNIGRQPAGELRQSYPKGSTDRVAEFLHGIIRARSAG